MPFTDSCRNVRLEGSELRAECRTADGLSYKPSSISLDTLLGNIEGEFRWGYRDFSKSARNIRIENAQLSAELQNSKGHWIHATSDLNAKIANTNGVLESVNLPIVVGPKGIPEKLTDANHTLKTDLKSRENLERTTSISSASSAMRSSSSMISTSTEKSSYFDGSSVATTPTSAATPKEEAIRKSLVTKFFVETCRRYELKGAVLHAECLLADGVTWKSTTLDLDGYIGNQKGNLVWECHDFSHSCQKIHLDGTHLIADCQILPGKETKSSTLDLAARLRDDNGTIIVIGKDGKLVGPYDKGSKDKEVSDKDKVPKAKDNDAILGGQVISSGNNEPIITVGNITTDGKNVPIDEQLSKLLSEIPWMKFKVVAEPDFSVISTNPVLKQTITKVAESTVKHVIEEMTSVMTTAIATATAAVTASAMKHISESVEVIVQGPAAGARIQRSHSEQGYLRTFLEHGIEIPNGHAASK